METTEQTIQRVVDVRKRICVLRAFVAGMRDSHLGGIEGLLSVAVSEVDRRLASLKSVRDSAGPDARSRPARSRGRRPGGAD